MAPPDLTQETNAVLKLHLANKGETRRIALRKLWNCDTENVSFQHLVDLALQYSGCEEENVSEVCITYTDEDGDTITISSDEELAEAFEQFVHKLPPVVRATAKVKQADIKNETADVNDALQAQLKIRQQRRILQLKKQQLKMHKRMERETKRAEKAKGKNEEVDCKPAEMLAKLAAMPPTPTTEPTTVKPRPVQKKAAVVPTTELTTAKPRPVQKKAAVVPTTELTTANVPKAEPTLNRPKIPASFNPDFIHGRHTCDGCFTTPIIGYRFNATNRPDYDLCHNCFKNYKGDEIRFLPEQLDRDVHLQQRWHNRQLRRQRRTMMFQGREQAKSCGITPHTIPAHEKTNTDQTDDNFSKSALDEAIRRSLLHATVKKADNTPKEKEVAPKKEEVAPKEEEVTPKEEEVAPKKETEKAQPKVAEIPPPKEPEDSIKDLIQGMFDHPIEKPATAAALTVAKHFAELLKAQKAQKEAQKAASAPTTASSTNPVSSSDAEKEDKVNDEGSKKPPAVEENNDTADEPEIEVAKDEVKVEDASVEEVIVENASVEEEEPEVKTPSANTKISIEPIDTLVLEIEKPQIADPSNVSEDDLSYASQLGDPSNVPDDDLSYVPESGEMILDGDDANVADTKSEGGSSNGDWQVVDENGQNVSDAMVAHAAQMLGSALFESDANVASTNDITNDAANSCVSGLTSVPSITTAKSAISAVLLNRWEDELRQLHELGFLDDHANVEAFGHLEAANMGVGSNDPITVEKVVNYLLNQ